VGRAIEWMVSFGLSEVGQYSESCCRDLVVFGNKVDVAIFTWWGGAI